MSPSSASGRQTLIGGLLAVLCFVSGCGMMSSQSEYQKYKAKENARIAGIQSTGGTAKREPKTRFGITMIGWEIDLAGKEINSRVISSIIEVARLDPVFRLNLSDSKITDKDLALLNQGKVLQKTVELNLDNTAITDQGLDALTDLCFISVLYIKGTKATENAAKKLGDRKIANPDTPIQFKKQIEVRI